MTETKKPKPGTKADLQVKLNAAKKQRDAALQLNAYLSRESVGRALGQSFGGERDLYKTLGYKLDPVYSDYLNLYERDGLATRVVDLVSDETWREHPILFESEDKAEDEKAEPGPLQNSFKELANRHDLWAQFLEADRMLGISRFSLLYLGLPGQPETEVTGKAGKLAYVITCDEGTATVDEMSIELDPESERFGLPEFYDIIVEDQGEMTKRVHYSRVIHIKRGRQRIGGLGRVYGVPGLKNVINRFWDLEKVLGGGSEAYWKLIYQGVVLKAMEGFTLPAKDTDEYKAMQDEWDEWEHNLRRVVRAQGLDVQELGGHPVDSREQFDVIVEYIAGAKDIPQRRLLGSERGNLASSQDDANFMDSIDSRRKNFAEPYILRPFLDRCSELGILKLPKEYYVKWPSLFQLTDLEKADLAGKVATAMNSASGGAPETIMPPKEYAQRYLDYVWTAEAESELIEIEEKNRGQDGGSFGNDGRTSPPAGGNGKNPQNVDLSQFRRALTNTPGGVDLDKAAYVTRTSRGPLIFHNETDHSAMVALRIPPALRKELQEKYPIIDDETRDNLHITLAFLGDSRTLDMEQAALAVSLFARRQKPIKTQLQGISRFISGGEKDPLVFTVDSPDFPKFRQALCDHLDARGIPYHREHGFIPHMTLAYIPSDVSEMPISTMEPLEVNFSDVWLVDGGEWYGIPLGVESVMDATLPGKKSEDD